jgi:hypothetical protein
VAGLPQVSQAAMWGSANNPLPETRTLGQVLGLHDATPSSSLTSQLGPADLSANPTLFSRQVAAPSTTPFNLPVDPFDQGMSESLPNAAGMGCVQDGQANKERQDGYLYGQTRSNNASDSATLLGVATLNSGQTNPYPILGSQAVNQSLNVGLPVWNKAQDPMDQLGLNAFVQPEAGLMYDDILNQAGTPNHNWLDELQNGQDSMVPPIPQSSSIPGECN